MSLPARLGFLVAVIVLVSPPARAESLRIVTLAPHGAEMVAAAGGERHLVGVAAFTDVPAMAADLPKVSDAYSVDRELILALRPGLVIAWDGGTRETDIAWLDGMGIRVYRSGPNDRYWGTVIDPGPAPNSLTDTW